MSKILSINCQTNEQTTTESDRVIDVSKNSVAAHIAAEKKAEDKTNAKAKLKAAEYTPLTQDEADAIVI